MTSLLLVMLPLNTAILAADSTPPAAVVEAFEARSYQGADGHSLPYRLLKPQKIEAGKRYPLVLFLHGAGERGDDNLKQLFPGADEFAKTENRKKYPCFLVVPQCPRGGWWSVVRKDAGSPDVSKEPFQPLKFALELVDRLAAEMPVDPSRICITGLSMGGYGTWDAIQRRPSYFAAAIPVCGGGDPAQGSKLKNIPIWAFHGDKDSVVPVGRTTDMIDAVRQAGGTPKMTIYEGVGHDSWTRAYADPEVLAWLFAQKK